MKGKTDHDDTRDGDNYFLQNSFFFQLLDVSTSRKMRFPFVSLRRSNCNSLSDIVQHTIARVRHFDEVLLDNLIVESVRTLIILNTSRAIDYETEGNVG